MHQGPEIYFDAAGIGSKAPKFFAAQQAAVDYTKTAFAGGRAEIIRVGQEDILVVQLFGSGVPVIFVAAYRLAADGWKLASEWLPRGRVQFYSVKERNGDVVVTGNTTGEEWVVLDL